jgi:hypothetical protein
MGSTAIAPPEERLDQPGADEKRALIDRIVASAQFRRSARMRDFLLYVGGQSLKDGTQEIHEQEIGAKVFGRRSDYDTSQDNIVRVAATELRKRIELYFASEGAHETVILEIPRGGYKPIFRRRALPLPPVPGLSAEAPPLREDAPPDPGAAPVRERHSYRIHLVWTTISLATVCLALAIGCLLLFQQVRSMRRVIYTWEGKPALSALWQDFIKPSQQTDVVLPDASLSIREELTGHPVSLSEYIDRQYVKQTESLPVSKDRRDDLADIYSHNLVAFGDFRAAQEILALSPVGSLHLTLSRFFQAESVKRDNLILIGGKKANPWIYMFDDQVNFSLDFDDARGLGYIANRHPRPGEAASYIPSSQYPNGFVGYSVVAYLPNPSHNGNTIILAGTDSDATSAAAEFLTSEKQLKKFQSTLHVQKFPYFEVLLKTSRLSGTSLNSEILAYRIYPSF